MTDAFDLVRKVEIEGFMLRGARQIEQVRRRVVLGETANPAHGEKVFSIFQPHTEGISKGKVGGAAGAAINGIEVHGLAI